MNNTNTNSQRGLVGADTIPLSKIQGRIIGNWLKSDNLAHCHYPSFEIHNTISYTAADVLAAAYGGDIRRIPKYMGFLYGPNKNASLSPITRDMTMESIQQLAESVKGNIQVVRFNRPPIVSTYSTDDDSSESSKSQVYTGNVVSFYGVTRPSKDGIYTNSTLPESQFAGQLSDGHTIYRALLLGDGLNPCEDDKYTVLAMVDLKKNNEYREKPEGYELALEWRVTFE